jgi:HK97 family phage major capsid protein
MTREEKLAKAQSLIEDGHVDEARQMISEIKSDDADAKEKAMTKSLDDEAKNIDADNDRLQELKEDEREDAEKGDSEGAKELEDNADNLEKDMKEDAGDVEDLKDDLAELKRKKVEKRSLNQTTEGVEEDMEKVVLDGKEVAETEVNEVRSFLDYIRSKETRALPADLPGMKSADGAAIIPEEIITKAKMLPETVYDLRRYVSTQKVSHAVGKYPILKSNQAKLTPVAELLKNPDLENPEFTEVKYEVETYRGQLAVAQEALDDSDDDLGGIISRHIQRQALNTANDAIAKVLRTAEAVTATSIDDIKDQINVEFDPAYRLEFLVSQSFYNTIDKLKDTDGKYLLQPDLTAPSGKQFLGRPVTILADQVIGTAKGDQVAFLGEPSAFAVFFDRVDTSVRWVENMYYGQVLAVAMRFDVEVVDPAAGKFITLDVTPPVEG